jgi:GNAT superfamily N-acetyltransferase
MIIRIATAADAEAIAQLHAASWRTAYRGIYTDDYLDNYAAEDRRTVWLERFAAPLARRCTILAEGDGRLEGFICVEGAQDPNWGSLIDNLHVAPTLKRSGIGRILMRGGSAWLRARYASLPVYLWVLEANNDARRFYESLGATNAETVPTNTADSATNSSCRYTWPSPEALMAACEPPSTSNS